MGKHYSPLRYPGGKNCIFPFISQLFYENQLIGISYAEPYAGGAGLALRLLFEGYVDRLYINDLDKSIFAFWKTIIENPDDMCRWIEKVEINIKNWKKYKEIQMNRNDLSLFELAKSTFFLNRTNVSGVIKGGVIGGVDQTGNYKINARFNKDDLIKKIQNIKKLRSRISVTNFDGIRFINSLDKKKKEIFIYIDPPYLQKGADLYMNFYSKEDHKMLSKQARRLRKEWIISYDNHEFIMNLYANNRKIIHKLSQSTSNKVGEELIIFSDKIRFSSSFEKLKSPAIC